VRGLEDLAVGQFDAGGVARRLVAIEDELMAGDQLDLAVGELADAQLRTLQVRQDRGRAPYFCSRPRIASNSGTFDAWSPWLMLIRNASAPASKSFPIISGVLLDGPSVARMRTLRVRGLIAFVIVVISSACASVPLVSYPGGSTVEVINGRTRPAG
jgi:hypothetical protein